MLKERAIRLWWLLVGPRGEQKSQLNEIGETIRTEIVLAKQKSQTEVNILLDTIKYSAAFDYLSKIGMVDQKETWPGMYDTISEMESNTGVTIGITWVGKVDE